MCAHVFVVIYFRMDAANKLALLNLSNSFFFLCSFASFRSYHSLLIDAQKFLRAPAQHTNAALTLTIHTYSYVQSAFEMLLEEIHICLLVSMWKSETIYICIIYISMHVYICTYVCRSIMMCGYASFGSCESEIAVLLENAWNVFLTLLKLLLAVCCF